MKKTETKPLAVSEKIERLVYLSHTQQERVAEIDAEIRPLVEALELVYGNIGCYEASSFVKHRFAVTWKEGAAALRRAKGEDDAED